MDYKIELKPFEKKKGQKYKTFQITDIALHTNNMRSTQKVGKKMMEAMEKQEPGRIYSKIEKQSNFDSRTMTLDLLKNDPEFVKMIQEEEKKGYKILISFPKEGIPVTVGKDTVDFVNSVRGKRILRRLYKQKEK